MTTTETIPQPPPLTPAELDAAFATLERVARRLASQVEEEAE